MGLRIWKSISDAESAVFVSSLPLEDAMRSLATVVERASLQTGHRIASWGTSPSHRFVSPDIAQGSERQHDLCSGAGFAKMLVGRFSTGVSPTRG